MRDFSIKSTMTSIRIARIIELRSKFCSDDGELKRKQYARELRIGQPVLIATHPDKYSFFIKHTDLKNEDYNEQIGLILDKTRGLVFTIFMPDGIITKFYVEEILPLGV